MSDKPRYMIDHGAIHDLVSGTHMRTSPEADGDPGDEQLACCKALNAQDAELTSLRAEVERLRGALELARIPLEGNGGSHWHGWADCPCCTMSLNGPHSGHLDHCTVGAALVAIDAALSPQGEVGG